MTFSAADLERESLAKLMPNYEASAAGTNDQKMKIAAINLKNNPHIAAYHFMDRFQSFFQGRNRITRTYASGMENWQAVLVIVGSGC
ncbi:hypothetical protein E4U27_003966 [Claviceps purpurea]|nr:hypothetical protein E4U27_003966 [Claviceps purpurea]